MAKPSFGKKEAPLDYGALVKELRDKGPGRLYLLWGEEDYLLADFVTRLRAACVGGEDDAFDAKRIDAPAPAADDIADALDAMPFFGERTFVELRGFDVNKCRDERIATLFADIPEWCTTVITLPTGSEPDGRLSFIKQLKTAGKAVNFTAQAGTQLHNWIVRRFEANGKKIDRNAVERLVFLSGDLMNRLIPEIAKISGYVSGERVTVQDIETLAHHIPEADAFQMTEEIARRNYDGAAAKLAELLAGDAEPIEIMGVIGWQMRQLYAAKIAEKSGKGMPFLMEILGTSSEYRARKLAETAAKFSLPALTSGVRLCAEYAMKPRQLGGALTDTEAVKEFLLRFAAESRHA